MTITLIILPMIKVYPEVVPHRITGISAELFISPNADDDGRAQLAFQGKLVELACQEHCYCLKPWLWHNSAYLADFPYPENLSDIY